MDAIAEAAVRATILAGGVGAVLRVLRLRAPRLMHGAWAAVAATMLLLPACAVWGPRVPLPIVVSLAGEPAMISADDSARNGTEPTAAETTPTRSRTSLAEPLANWATLATLVYGAGVLLLLARIVMGVRRAGVLRREAVLTHGRLTHSACVTPMSVGFVRPAVILPEDWTRWHRDDLAAVIAHEDEHVRRRDALVTVLTLLNRAVFWFHPLAWWLHRRVSTLAEQACDVVVVSTGHDARRYAACLVRFARRASRAGCRVHAVAMPITGTGLRTRLTMVVSPPHARPSRVRVMCGAAACALVAVMGATAAPSATRVEAAPSQAPGPGDPNSAWPLFTSDHFEIFHDRLPEDRVRDAARVAEDAYRQVSGLLKYDLPSRVPVFLVQRNSDLVVPQRTGRSPEGQRIVLSLERINAFPGAIAHELTHAFAFEIVPETSRVTPFVVEGLAWHLSGGWNGAELTRLRDAAASGAVPSVTVLGPTDEVWAQAVFEFVAARDGDEGIRRLLFALRAHGTISQAIPMAFGSSSQQFDEGFRQYVVTRFR